MNTFEYINRVKVPFSYPPLTEEDFLSIKVELFIRMETPDPIHIHFMKGLKCISTTMFLVEDTNFTLETFFLPYGTEEIWILTETCVDKIEVSYEVRILKRQLLKDLHNHFEDPDYLLYPES